MKLNSALIIFIATMALSFGAVAVKAQTPNAKLNRYARGEKHSSIVNGHRVIKGERPPIDIALVPQEAFEKGMIFLMINRELQQSMPNALLSAKNEGYVITGLAALDELNKEFGATLYKPFLYDLYESTPKMKDFDHRHRAWDFHLWFEISLDINVNIKEAVQAYAKLKEVEMAEPVYRKRLIEPVYSKTDNGNNNAKFTPDDPLYASNQWHFNNTGQVISGTAGIAGIDIQLEDAWDIEMGNSNVLVSVHDGGIQFNHPDLAANMWGGIGPDGANTNADSHGTHVAGTVAAVTHNGLGVAGIAGGSGSGNGVRLMSVDVFEGTLSTYNGYVYAANNGAAISQNSWGYLEPNAYNTPDLNGIDYFNANGGGEALDGGGIVIFAAGNDNSNENWYPGYYSGTLAVASHTNRGTRSNFSNYGSWVDISAPGSGIYSTNTNSGYSFKSGTSMACPHVSGVAALVASYSYGALNPDQLWEILVENVDDIYEHNPTFTGQLGLGRLNAYKALEAVQVYLGGVHKPNNFTASLIGATTIELNWEKNDAGDDVLVLWSLTPSFGSLIQEQDYSEGEEIEGGGVVLYKGDATQFVHTNLLDNTTYYYRVYSFNANHDYSPGVRANVTTAWGVQPIIFEGFEPPDITGQGIVPLGWQVKRNTESLGGLNGGGLFDVTDGWWQVSEHKPFFDGSYLQYIRSGEAAIAIALGALNFNWAISPVIVLPSNCESISLSFWMWYASTGANGERPSNFYFQIFADNEWHLMRSWIGEENNNWSTPIEFDITEFQGKPIKLGFIMEYTYGYPIAIDDISITAVSKDAEIFSFSFNEQFNQTTIISDDGSGNGLVELIVIKGSDLYNLIPSIMASPGATTNPPSGVEQDFTVPVTYTVTAHDGVTTKDWLVNVSEASGLSNRAEIISFNVDIEHDMIIIIPNDGSGNGLVKVAVPAGTSAGELAPTIGISAGATISPESGIPQDFSGPVHYTVTGQNGSTTKDWIAIVHESSNDAEILSFILDEQISEAVIEPDDGWGTGNITVEVAYGTDVTNLSPSITISEGATVYPLSNMAVDFTEPVHYLVRAQDGITYKSWYVSIDVETGVELDPFNDLRVYPNPFGDRLNISNAEKIKRVYIVNIMGQVIKYFDISSNDLTINTQEITPGIYLMVFQSKTGQRYVQRMVKR